MHTSLCCPDDVKTMAGNDVNGDLERQKHCINGGLMRVWLTMDQNETRNNGAQVTDNIHSLDQMLV